MLSENYQFINEFSKIAGYTINTQTQNAFLYINNEISEREIMEIIPFILTSKKNKISRNKPT